MSKPINLAMLIDDDEVDQRMYKRVMMKSNLVEDVIIFSYADEALQHIRNNSSKKADVIFLDINMPRMDGFEFLEKANNELSQEFETIVVAMLTTSLNPDDERRALSFDAVKMFITKPLETEHVQQVAQIISAH